MATSIGDYAISVKTDAREFQKGMEQVVVTTQKTTAAIIQTTTETTKLANGSRNTTFAIQQLALGLQDAASVFGTSGFGGAVRAAGNNVIQFASLLSPLGGTIAAVAITGVQMLTDYFTKQAKAAGEAKQAVVDYADSVKLIQADVKRARGLADVAGMENPEQARNHAKGLQKRLDDAAKEAQMIDADIGGLDAEQLKIEARLKRGLVRRMGPGGGIITEDPFPEGNKRLAEIEQEREALRKAGDEARKNQQGLQEEINAAKKREAELVRQEYGKVFQDLDGERAQRANEMIRKESEALAAKEKGRQELIAESRRDELAENTRRAQMLKSVQPNFQYAGYGSADAAEALSRARTAVADDAKNYYDKSLGIQENMLDQLVELNRAQQDANVDVIEDFLF